MQTKLKILLWEQRQSQAVHCLSYPGAPFLPPTALPSALQGTWPSLALS